MSASRDRPAESLTCPYCLGAIEVGSETREALLRTLEGWDRRFATAQMVLQDLLCLLVEGERGGLQAHRTARAKEVSAS